MINLNEVQKKGFIQRLRKVGPGLIIAAAAIGPGTVTTTSVIGSKYGYGLLWLIILAIVIRALFTKAVYSSSLVLKMPTLDAIRHFYGNNVGALTGILLFLGSVAFQVGNFTGTGMGLSLIYGGVSYKVWGAIITIVSIWLIFSKDVYNRVEFWMKLCVYAMVLAFGASLVMAGGPSVGGIFKGMIPSFPDSDAVYTSLAFIASTAALSGVTYSTYMGKEKQWTLDELKDGTVNWDVLIGVGSIGLIVLLVMFTTAEVLFPRGIVVKSAQHMADTLTPIIGDFSRFLLGFSFFSAALSSMIVNAQLGATMLLSGIGKTYEMKSQNARIIGAILLVFGCVTGIVLGKAPVSLLLAAQVASIISTPLLGLLIILLMNRKEMGEFKASAVYTISLVVSYSVIIIITLNNLVKLLKL